MSTRKYECAKLKMISNCSRLSSTASSASRPGCVWRTGTANGTTLSPLMMRPTIYAALLRKNSDDSTWIWKFGAALKSPETSAIDCITHCTSRSRSSKGGVQLEVGDDAFQRRGEPVLRRVIRAIRRLRGWFAVLDVLGRDGRAHEDEIVVEVRAMQDLAAHRVEERLGALGLPVRREQPDIVQLDLLPDFVVDVFRVVFVFEQHHALVDAIVVRRDALACELLQRKPVGPSKSVLAVIAASRNTR